MKILLAPDRFHPTMKAQAVAAAMVRGLASVSANDQIGVYPMASGGFGTTDLVVRAVKGRVRQETLKLPNRHSRDVKWALLPDGTAIFDAREALGSPDGPSQLNQTTTDSSPLGLMMQRLMEYKPRQIAVALGDVLAADGGLGLLRNFGLHPFNEMGDRLGSGSRQLLNLERIDFSQLEPPQVPIMALIDQGVSWNHRVQQDDFQLDLMYGGLHNAVMRFGDMLAEHIAMPLRDLPGTGSGGGLGLALTFLGAQLVSGADYLSGLYGLREALWQADWILTGASLLGTDVCHQATGLVARLARDAGVPAIALTMDIRQGHAALYDMGLTGIYSVLDRPRSLREVQRMLPSLIEKAAYRTGMWMQGMSDPS